MHFRVHLSFGFQAQAHTTVGNGGGGGGALSLLDLIRFPIHHYIACGTVERRKRPRIKIKRRTEYSEKKKLCLILSAIDGYISTIHCFGIDGKLLRKKHSKKKTNETTNKQKTCKQKEKVRDKMSK